MKNKYKTYIPAQNEEVWEIYFMSYFIKIYYIIENEERIITNAIHVQT